jgi:hypothetical protein
VATALALGLLDFYLAILGRGALVVVIAAGLVTCCSWSPSTSTGRPAV